MASGLIGIIGDREGFQQRGGIQTLYRLLCRRLEHNGFGYTVVTAKCGIPKGCTHLFVLGCGSPWAYKRVARVRFMQPNLPISWIPCFHPLHIVRHKSKARLARLALSFLQLIGVDIHALTVSESQALNLNNSKIISLPFDCEDNHRAHTQISPTSSVGLMERPNALVFLGRPVAQKGWPLFLTIVSQIEHPCIALVPYQPEGNLPRNLTVVINSDDLQIIEELRQAKMLILPSDYESFGFAQAEAMLLGCIVPVLGEWPLWLDVKELDWRWLNVSEILDRIKAMLNDSQQWTEIQHKQRCAWLARPERQTPALPYIYA
jgi:glycosyltransferase involved in cell wall biosynthesis